MGTAARPVIIAGAGPVGLTTALLLARHKVPVVILEARTGPNTEGSRAIAFQRDVFDIFDRAGCAGRILAHATPWGTGRTYYRGQELRAVTYPDPGDSPFPPWANISQTEVEAALRDRAAREPLIELRWGEPVADATISPDGVLVDTGTRVLAGSHLIGADGAHSTVRDVAGIGFEGRSYPDRFLIVDLRADLPFPRERRFHFDPPFHPGRQVLIHQCPEETWRVDWQVEPGFDLAADRASGRFDQRVRAVIGDRPYEVRWASVYHVEQRLAPSFARDRVVFLAGDAAHRFIPHGARGLNSGLQDADNLAWKLALTWHGQAPAALLDSYHAERHPAALENLRVTNGTLRFLIPQTVADRQHAHDTLERALTDPAARDAVNSGNQAEPYWYLHSPLTTPPDHPGAFDERPLAARPPVPGVLCPDAPCQAGGRPTRLRQLIGTGFLLLLADPARLTEARHAAGPATRVHALPHLDDDGRIAALLSATPGSAHLIRPDGHIAAVLPTADTEQITAAIHRACGAPQFTESEGQPGR